MKHKVSCMNVELFPKQRNCSTCAFEKPYRINSFDQIDGVAGEITAFVLNEVRRCWCSEKIKYFIRLVLLEAVPNAVEHGIAGIASEEKKALLENNGHDRFLELVEAKWAESGKAIEVTACVNAERILLGIHDHGAGFDPHMYDLDLSSKDDLLNVSGRGLKLLHTMGVDLHWNDKGNSILCAITDGVLRTSDKVTQINQITRLGIEEFDEQHKQMFELFNYIQENIARGAEMDVKLLMWDELSKYAKMHFLVEEAVLGNCEYLKMEHHVKEHTFFISKIRELTGGGFADVHDEREMAGFLATWWQNHICHVDKQYVPFLRSKGLDKTL